MDATVTVTGIGQASAVPDEATVRLAAVQRAANVGEAFAVVSTTVDTIVEIAQRHTERTRISTRDLVVWPAHDNQGQQVGWECRHSLSVTLADLTQAGALITEVAAEVGERMVIDGVGLSVSDPSAALARARDAAMNDARERAEQYAQHAGLSVGQVLRVSEGPGHAEAPVAFGGAERMMAMKDASLEPGERQVPASVTVTWALL
ncbi:MAG: SIMPL domain-containing protein [Nocardioides sp.]|jgi:uncharacterized protein YggE